jgi:hypothetical protein
MKCQVASWLLLALLGVPLASLGQDSEKAAQAEQEPAGPPPADLSPPFAHQPAAKPTSRASGVIYIQPGTGPSDTNLAPLYALLRSQQVQQAAINEVAKQQLGKVPEDLKAVEIGIIEATHTANVISYDERLRADLVLEQLRIQAAQGLANLDRNEKLREQEHLQGKILEQMRADLARNREQLFLLAKLYNVEVDPQIENQRRLQLAAEKQRLQVELNGLNARQAILEKQIATMAELPLDEAAKRVESELLRVIQARKQQIAYLREVQARPDKDAAASAAEKINLATAELAQAEVEFSKFRREAAAGGNLRATELRHRLDDTLIEAAEIEAKLASLKELTSFSTQVEDKRLELELDEEQFRRARQEYDETLAKRLSYVPPQVILIRTK